MGGRGGTVQGDLGDRVINAREKEVTSKATKGVFISPRQRVNREKGRESTKHRKWLKNEEDMQPDQRLKDA